MLGHSSGSDDVSEIILELSRSAVGSPEAPTYPRYKMSSTTTTLTRSSSVDGTDGKRSHSLIRRSLAAVSDTLSPFSSSAIASLPRLRRPAKYNRADAIPENATDEHGQRTTVRDYHSINLPPQVRIPKKIPTPIRIEAKIWFANERSMPSSYFCCS